MFTAGATSRPSHRRVGARLAAFGAIPVHSVFDLRAALQQARARSLHVVTSAVEAACLPEAQSLFVDTSTLGQVLGLDTDRGCIEVQAGVRWPELAANLAARLQSPLRWILPDEFGEGTVGGTVAANAAGRTLVTRPVAAITQALTLVGADGELRRASRELNPELFRAAIGGHGAFGIIYSVKLRLSRNGAAPQTPETETTVQRINAYMATLRVAHTRPAVRVEMLISPGCAEEVLAEATTLLDARALTPASLQARSIAQDAETLLTWAQSHCISIEIGFARPATLSAGVRLAQACRELIDLALGRGGRFRLGNPYASREQVETAYPNFAAFLAEARRCDPAERFTNPWLQHHRNLFGRLPCEVRWCCAQPA